MPQCAGPRHNITFSDRMGNPVDPFEPNTGEHDEQETIFGQGRSPKRQERDARSFSAASFALAIVIIALAMLYFPN